MALLRCNSFEDVTTGAALLNRFDSNTIPASVTSATTGARTGTRSLGLTGTASLTTLWSSLGGSGNTLILGFSIYMPTLPTSSPNTFLTITPNSGTAFSLAVSNSSGSLLVSGATSLTSTATLATNTLLYVQIKVTFNGSSSSYSGVFGSVPISGTFSSTGTSITSFTLASTVQMYFDDLVVADTSGTRNNDLLGQPKVECLRPTGAGSNTGLSLSGAPTDWQAVGEASPDDDTSFVFGEVAGAKDTYQTGDLAAVAGAIAGIQVNLRARKDDALTRQICPEFHIAGTDYDGGTKTLTTGYVNYTDVREVSPATAAPFTVSEINGMEVGAKVIA